ncbi:MAG: hypothetical protein ACJAT7_003466 [Psychromonas sp.]|jgi:hypothetical protein
MIENLLLNRADFLLVLANGQTGLAVEVWFEELHTRRAKE